jgi:hypothetical protein
VKRLASALALAAAVAAACTSSDSKLAQPAPAAGPATGPATAPGTPAAQPAEENLPALERDALVRGALPEGVPQAGLLENQCQTCHALEYVTQQRLTLPQWKKTLDKMRRFGAVVDDQQAGLLAAFAAHYWNPDLPERIWEPVEPPAGALPLAPTRVAR